MTNTTHPIAQHGTITPAAATAPPTAQPENKPGQQHVSNVQTAAANPPHQGQTHAASTTVPAAPQSPAVPIDPNAPVTVDPSDVITMTTAQASQIATVFANLAGALKAAGIVT